MWGCGSKDQDSFKTIVDEQEFYVNRQEKTIQLEEETYSYRYEGGLLVISLPTGNQYYGTDYSWREEETGSRVRLSEEEKAQGHLLSRVIKLNTFPDDNSDGYDNSNQGQGMKWLFIILLFIGGLFNILVPYGTWYLSGGYKYKDVEPTDLSLGLIRFSGGASLVICFFLIIFM